MMDMLYIPLSENKIICDNRFYTLEVDKIRIFWLYLNSIVFYITIELICRRLGGGASDIMVDDYRTMPVPDLSKLIIEYDYKRLDRPVFIYYKEIHQNDRRDLDRAVLKALGFEDPENILDELYSCFVEVVEDRLMKADRPLKRLQETTND